MEWLYVMKWSYKKFLYLRLELFLILNEWRFIVYEIFDNSQLFLTDPRTCISKELTAISALDNPNVKRNSWHF